MTSEEAARLNFRKYRGGSLNNSKFRAQRIDAIFDERAFTRHLEQLSIANKNDMAAVDELFHISNGIPRYVKNSGERDEFRRASENALNDAYAANDSGNGYMETLLGAILIRFCAQVPFVQTTESSTLTINNATFQTLRNLMNSGIVRHRRMFLVSSAKLVVRISR